MVTDLLTTSIVVLAIGIGVAFTYFGYSFVTRFTSLLGGLGGALVGSFAARLFISFTFGTPSALDLLLVSFGGAIVGGIVGSYVALSLQRVAIIGTSFIISSSLLYWLMTHPKQTGTIPSLSLISESFHPLITSILFGGLVSILVWKFYFLFLAGATSLLGASLLQQFALHWSTLLPIFQDNTWTTLGTSQVLWLLLLGSGIIVQYRRYRGISPHQSLRRINPHRLR
ncbi:hypothetical protein [Haladaptatus halobius]|uniref:hypothetical protein n=1 Tax=Haladaptatus halobius TaxID=2884875 RepID=UPI001D0B3194|nr:hypothetical protein [Haladaptatus halobius]